jgi:hypothetical protein
VVDLPAVGARADRNRVRVGRSRGAATEP